MPYLVITKGHVGFSRMSGTFWAKFPSDITRFSSQYVANHDFDLEKNEPFVQSKSNFPLQLKLLTNNQLFIYGPVTRIERYKFTRLNGFLNHKMKLLKFFALALTTQGCMNLGSMTDETELDQGMVKSMLNMIMPTLPLPEDLRLVFRLWRVPLPVKNRRTVMCSASWHPRR